MAGPSLKVTDNTTVTQLAKFASEVGKDATIHGKTHKDGSVTLYMSKNKGTGLKNYLFGTTEKRRAAANGTITQILFANTSKTKEAPLLKGRMGEDFTNLLGDIPMGGNALGGAKLKEIASIAKSSYDEYTLPGNMPPGVTFDAKGNLTGSTTFDKVPTDCTGQFGGHKGMDIAAALQQVKSESLAKTDKLNDCAGQKITGQAVSDFWRLDFDIPQANGSRFKSSLDKSEDQGTRNANATRAIRDFAGSDKATTVLSSVLTQTTLTPIPGCIAKSDGTESKYKFHSAFSRVGRDFTMRGADGKMTPVDPQFVGGAKWTLSKVGNDFKISVAWQSHCEAEQGREAELPLHKDGLIGIDFSLDFLVDGAEAAKGNLKLSMPGGVQAQFSGRLTGV